MEAVLSANKVNFKQMIHYPLVEIEKDAVTFISGDSGCGKSTLLKLFNGTLSPDSGTLYYCGQNISEMDTIALRREVLLVDQSIFLFDQSIRENFNSYYGYRGLPSISEEKMNLYLNLCCADFPLDKDCILLSGGERQRVYLSIFLSFLPKVLMLDEPTSALDPNTATEVLSRVFGFCRQKEITPVVVSHDKEIVHQFAQKNVRLKKEAAYGPDR